jgi:hypothetical protein
MKKDDEIGKTDASYRSGRFAFRFKKKAGRRLLPKNGLANPY